MAHHDGHVDLGPSREPVIVRRLAAFSDGPVGGNPAGVVLADAMPSVAAMQSIAADVGYSETAFATPLGDRWHVRYFSPEAEVPFCGHATVALGAALAERHGDGRYALHLETTDIVVEGRRDGPFRQAALQAPPTRSRPAPDERVTAALDLFGLDRDDLDPRIPTAEAHAGADHLVLMLTDRATLATMIYDFARGRTLMREAGWVTILLGHAHDPQRFATRNAFAWGGVVEEPATGAATAALAGYLRDFGWPHRGAIEVEQGVEMGRPSRLHAAIPPTPGASIRVSGTVRAL